MLLSCQVNVQEIKLLVLLKLLKTGMVNLGVYITMIIVMSFRTHVYIIQLMNMGICIHAFDIAGFEYAHKLSLF